MLPDSLTGTAFALWAVRFVILFGLGGCRGALIWIFGWEGEVDATRLVENQFT